MKQSLKTLLFAGCTLLHFSSAYAAPLGHCGALLAGGSTYDYEDVSTTTTVTINHTLGAVRILPGKETDFNLRLATIGTRQSGAMASVLAGKGLVLIELDSGRSEAKAHAGIKAMYAAGIIDFYAQGLDYMPDSVAVTSGEIRFTVPDALAAQAQSLLRSPAWKDLVRITDRESDYGETTLSLSSHEVMGTKPYDLRKELAAALANELGTKPEVYLNLIRSIKKP